MFALHRITGHTMSQLWLAEDRVVSIQKYVTRDLVAAH